MSIDKASFAELRMPLPELRLRPLPEGEVIVENTTKTFETGAVQLSIVRRIVVVVCRRALGAHSISDAKVFR